MGYDQIWAPWRLGYILGDKSAPEPRPLSELLPGAEQDCFLCQAGAGGPDQKRLVLCGGPHSVTMLNLYPYNNGHLLVAPRRHAARLDELSGEEQLELTETITRMITLLERVMSPQGFNVGLNLGREAGAGLPGHLHWHIVPRWGGDANFMPSVAAINVIPQSLDATWEALIQGIEDGAND